MLYINKGKVNKSSLNIATNFFFFLLNQMIIMLASTNLTITENKLKGYGYIYFDGMKLHVNISHIVCVFLTLCFVNYMIHNLNQLKSYKV